MSDQAATSGGIRHVAWLYRSADEYLAGVREFVQAAVLASAPVLIAVPASRLPPGWAGEQDRARVRTVDVTAVGRNPARMMPVLHAFAQEHPGQRPRVVAELAWAGRSAAELGEVARYEQALNLELAGAQVSVLCPYSTVDLPGSAISAACASHPTVREYDSKLGRAACYAAPDGRYPVVAPLLAPPGAQTLAYADDLRQVRALVAATAARAGLSEARRIDLVIAASEVAANTLKHTTGGGVVRVWVTDDEVLCQLEDSGHITDPLAGYDRPAGDASGGQGLWLVNQVCDLAEMRTGERGTTVRLHMYRDLPRAELQDAARTRQDSVN
ncbi:MAG TPA: anti-sigma factor RsbA family regulatory protein [Streptosporangiaceae bacterium]|nr:anti-sigma factor RsbA family regulatory protein [Streptosporangiaceae bacterium]